LALDTNTLFYGDNFEILKRISNKLIDLIYLDPPCNSKSDYNILFKESTGEQSTAQIQAFSDFWKWDKSLEMHMDFWLQGVSTKLFQNCFRHFMIL
jgi:site-specific DNA-methyltransferase (adenine-specific)